LLEDIVLNLYRVGVIRFGDFILASGRRSQYYFDFRILPSHPELYSKVINLWLDTLRSYDLRFDGVVGIASAGIVHAAVLGFLMRKPVGYVRAERKDHGTSKLVEGDLKGLKVIVVDDVVTTGGTLTRAYNILKEEGIDVVAFSVILDREEGATESLKSLGIPLIPLMRTSQVFRILKDLNVISDELYNTLTKHLGSPK
jgi:orotate phosphoribosyltransferase